MTGGYDDDGRRMPEVWRMSGNSVVLLAFSATSNAPSARGGGHCPRWKRGVPRPGPEAKRHTQQVSEHLMNPHPLLDYQTDDARRQLADILGGIIPSYESVYSGTR